MSTSRRATPSRLLRIESICNQFETDKQNGSENSIGEYLPNGTSETGFEIARQLLIIEWDYRLQQGEQLQLHDIIEHELLPADTLKLWFDEWRKTRNTPGKIAHFRLIEKLGSGSFGTVWRAFDERLNRDVALKVAHESLSGDADRFLKEAKSAAQLRHRAIVKILDAGEWDGRFCIVQEYVAADSLANLLKTKTFSFAESVELCLTLAEALECSHEQGCIHRDIKPQNVLIQRDGQPVLIDFGLAKNTSNESSNTRSGTIMGTPVFMSPEQARGHSHLADARSDIYSTGILLFNLLTGEVPFHGNFEMVLLQVLNNDPPNPRKLNRDIPVELATICLKCIEKEPRRRYATATELAEDLRRYLAGQAVMARPHGQLYRAVRWTRRNPLLAALIGSLIVLATTITWNAVEAEKTARQALQTEQQLRGAAVMARDQADRLAEQARVEARLAKQVTAFLEEVFSWGDQLGTQLYDASSLAGIDISLSQLLDRAVERIDIELSEQPRVRMRLLDIISNAYRSRGDFAEAQLLIEKAEQVRDELVKQNPNLDLQRELALHTLCQGRLLQSLGDYDASFARLEESLKAHQGFLDENDLEIAEVLFQIGWLHLEWRKGEQAETYLNQALAIRKHHLPADHRLVWTTQLAKALCASGPNPGLMTLAISAVDQEFAPDIAKLAIIGVNIQISRTQRDFEKCERLYRQVLENIPEKFGARHPVRILATGDFASILQERGKYAEAFELIEAAIEVGEKLAPNHPQLKNAYKKVGHEMFLAGRYAEAERYLIKARRFHAPDERIDFSVFVNLAQTLVKLEKFDEAAELLNQEPEPPEFSERHCAYLIVQAEICRGIGDLENAMKFDQLAAADVDVIGMHYQSPTWLRRFAGVCMRVGDSAKAEELLRLSLDKEVKDRPAAHPRTSDSHFELGKLLFTVARTDEAIPHLELALKMREQCLPPNDLRIAESKEWLDKASLSRQ